MKQILRLLGVPWRVGSLLFVTSRKLVGCWGRSGYNIGSELSLRGLSLGRCSRKCCGYVLVRYLFDDAGVQVVRMRDKASTGVALAIRGQSAKRYRIRA